MSTRVNLVDSDGRQYGFLDGVDDSSVISNIRIRAAKDLPLVPAKYLFTWRNTPVSSKQEATLKIRRCAKVIAEDPEVLEIVITLTEKVVPESTNEHRNSETKSQRKMEEPGHIHQSKPPAQECGKEIPGLRLFTSAEIEHKNISRMEKERRSFWNSLVHEISCHSLYNKWSVQAQKGILDTEWTLRKSELLKIEAHQVMKLIKIDDAKYQKISEKEKTINQHLDHLSQVDFKRKSTYENIEYLHKQLKCRGTNRHFIEEQITENEATLDKLFTQLKSIQRSLEMTISHAKHNKDDELIGAMHDNLEQRKVAELTDEEINEISQSVMDDFEVEQLSD